MTAWVSAEEARRLMDGAAMGPWLALECGDGPVVVDDPDRVPIAQSYDGMLTARLIARAPDLAATVGHLWAEVARLQALLAASPLRVAPSEHDGSAA